MYPFDIGYDIGCICVTVEISGSATWPETRIKSGDILLVK
jgi:hypothetical protein